MDSSEYKTPMEKLSRTMAAIERAVKSANGEPGDAQRALQELEQTYLELWYPNEKNTK